MARAALGMVLAAFVAAGLLAADARAAEPARARPLRLVSLNLCGDQYLVRLADRTRIVSLSRLATDPEMSLVSGEAAGIPRNFGRAEDVITLAPDLVLAGTYTDGSTRAMLKRLGVPLVELELAESVEAVKAQTRRVAAAIGEEARGEAWIARMEADLSHVPAPTDGEGRRPRAVYWDDNGFSLGAGTLVDELLGIAGYANLAREVGVAGYGRLPLEDLLLSRPDLVVMSAPTPGRPSRAREVLAHPALARATGQGHRLYLPPALTSCGTPDVAGIVPRLAEARS